MVNLNGFLTVFGVGGSKGPRATYPGAMINRGGRAIAQRVEFGAVNARGPNAAAARAARGIANSNRMANARAAQANRRGAR